MSYTRGIKRIVLTLQQRLEIVQKLQYGISVNQLAIDYGISSSTVRRIKSNALELRQRLEIPGAAARKKMRKPLMEELDARLYEWYLERRALGDYISDSILQAKAKKLNEAYGDTSKFTASKGWIWRFKNRYGIGLYDPRDERVEPDADAAEYFAQEFLRHLEEQNIKLQNIYNIDESTVMWKSLPQRILVRAGRKRGFANKVKNYRVTIGLCTNATGTHKLPPLFVCRYERPRALKHCRDRLPVTFKSQEMARVDWNVFAEWLESDFKPAVRKRQQETGSYGKVLLLLDNCAAHVVPPELEREDEDFQFIYLPVNTPSILQPMNQGIMTKVKRSFRNRVLKRILDFPFGVAEFYADYDIKDCVDFVNAAWTDVTSINIRSSWKRLLGDVAMEKEEKLSDDMSDIAAITDTAVKVAGEGVTQDEVVEWISACEDVEGKIDAFEGEKDESREQRMPLVLNDEEIEQTFTNLVLWTESQSDFVKLHVNQLNVYYNLGTEQSNDTKVEYDLKPVRLGSKAIDTLAFSFNLQKPFYVVVIDAGSTGSRALAFSFHESIIGGNLILDDELYTETKPGLSAYAENPKEAAKSLTVLLEKVKGVIPRSEWQHTPLSMRATAGLRLLPGHLAQDILQECRKLFEDSGFQVSKNSIAIMEGTDEGIFSWFTVNFLLERFSVHNPGSTVAALDLGGGSTQVTFSPTAAQEKKLDGHIYSVNIFNHNMSVYTHSYLGLGLMAARKAVVTDGMNMESVNPKATIEVRSECINPIVSAEWSYGGLDYMVKGPVNGAHKLVKTQNFAGGEVNRPIVNFSECLRIIEKYVGRIKNKPEGLKDHEIYAFSYYFDRATEVGLVDPFSGGVIQVSAFQKLAMDACDYPNTDQPFICLDLTYIYVLLRDGFGLEPTTRLYLYKRINGHELSWALGAAFNIIQNGL